EALQHFIRVVEQNREYDDEGARRACIAIFKTLGESHEITRQYRRPFSNALYS
ncbi:MAG TPA: thioredoxin, partial [Candidatus Latescibacteria bacterium]|nr:thioredoxin [Candidatus Latescibacterota bacterium]